MGPTYHIYVVIVIVLPRLCGARSGLPRLSACKWDGWHILGITGYSDAEHPAITQPSYNHTGMNDESWE